MPFSIRGPKGGLVVRRAPLARARKLLPALVKRFGSVTIGDAPPSTDAVRARIVAYCRWGVAHEPDIHYAQVRPIPVDARRELPLTTDCSGFATLAYLDAGAPDPNGNAYSGAGYTGTLCQHGRVVTLGRAKPGDLVFYGHADPWEHVAVYVGGGKVISHGSEGGPFLLAIDYRSDRGEIRTYLD